MLPRSRGSSSNTTGSGRASASTIAGSIAGRSASAITPVFGGKGASCVKGLRRDLAGQREQPFGEIGRQRGRETIELRGVAANDLRHVGAKAQSVLERMKALEHRQRSIAPSAPEARDERSLGHRAIMALLR